MKLKTLNKVETEANQEELWRRPPPHFIAISPERVAEQTLRELLLRGYVLWQCDLFDGATVCILADEDTASFLERLPGASRKGMAWALCYPTYTMAEMEMMADLSTDALRFIYKAKKLVGAVLTSVEKKGS